MDPVDRRLASWIAEGRFGRGIATEGRLVNSMAGETIDGGVGFAGNDGGNGTASSGGIGECFRFRSSSSASNSLIKTSNEAIDKSGAVELFIAGNVAIGRIFEDTLAVAVAAAAAATGDDVTESLTDPFTDPLVPNRA